MARPSLLIIEALRKTAKNIQNGKPYEWGHMGSCNCGNLAQTLLNISKSDIHRYAMEKVGDWSEQLNDYCPTSGLPMDQLIFGLLEKGFSTTDLKNLEYLSDQAIIEALGRGHLRNNNLTDVVDYLNAWANLLEADWIQTVPMPAFQKQVDVI
ncbi:hypothetical protein AEM51_09495 [Bacteroidetes bacterium UKL13-3]|jgi:hypothetical protein|nr:hypothetical protein AEM51_09495 [Bacteroidetes bacterium UKL13-3]HCP94684.1 hypothetical protein [Bacteroidota bacterium]